LVTAYEEVHLNVSGINVIHVCMYDKAALFPTSNGRVVNLLKTFSGDPKIERFTHVKDVTETQMANTEINMELPCNPLNFDLGKLFTRWGSW
jgi:hypothetical protein